MSKQIFPWQNITVPKFSMLCAMGMALVAIALACWCVQYGGQLRRSAVLQAWQIDQLQAQNDLNNAKTVNDDTQLRQATERMKEIEGRRLGGYLEPGREFTNWDGWRYEEIARFGYVWDGSDNSLTPDPATGEMRLKNVVWYPLYPVLGWVTAKYTGWPVHEALSVISRICIVLAAGVMFCLGWHWTMRAPALATQEMTLAKQAVTYGMWATAFMLFGSTAVFFYGNFTESLFVLLLTGFLLSLLKRHWWLAAVLAAIAAATRSQGVFFGPILALSYLLRETEVRLTRRIVVAGILGVISSLGLIAYMWYLQHTFGDPLVFTKGQKFWNTGINAATLSYATNPWHIIENLTHWLQVRPWNWPRVNEAVWLLLPPILLVIWGWRWLPWEFNLAAWIFWALPYVTHGQGGMPSMSHQWMSFGRFMSANVPLLMLMALIATRRPLLGGLLLGFSAVSFALLSLMYGMGMWVG